MLWSVYALLSAFFTTISNIIEKKALAKKHALQFSTLTAIFSFLFSFSFIHKVNFNIGLVNTILIFLVCIFTALGFLFIAKAIRHDEVSHILPYVNLNPLVVAVFAYFFLGETLLIKNIVGILLIIFGAFFLEMERIADVKKTIKAFLYNKYIHYVFASVFFYAISSLILKYVVMKIDVFTYLFISHFFLAIIFLLISSIKYGIEDLRIKDIIVPVILFSIFLIVSRLFLVLALQLAFVSLVIPIKRLSILFTTILAGKIFHEHAYLHRTLASIIMLIGAYLVII